MNSTVTSDVMGSTDIGFNITQANSTLLPYQSPINRSLPLMMFGTTVIAVGCILNTIAFVVMSRKVLSYTSASVYLRATAIGDTGVLLIYGLNAFGVYFQGEFYTSQAACWLPTILRETFRPAASWCVAALALDRVSVVIQGTNHRPHINKRCAQIITSLIFILWFLGSLQYAWTWHLDESEGTCHQNSQHEAFADVNNWVVQCLSSFLPSIIMISCTVPIGLAVHRSSRSSLANTAGRQGLKRASVTTLVISISYLVLTLPNAIATPLFASGAIPYLPGIMYPAYFSLMLNHSTNFFFYVVTGSVFRKELKLMCTGCK